MGVTFIKTPFNPHAEALAWLHKQDANADRDSWLKTLMVAASKGLTKDEVCEWSATGSKFDAADFGTAWTGALKKLSQPDQPAGTSAGQPGPTPEQQAVSSALAQQFISWPVAPDDHQYIKDKGIPPTGLKLAPDGRLAVPIRELDGTFRSVQFIAPDGTKKNAPGAGLGSGCFVVGSIKNAINAGRPVYVCEGLATAWAVFDADQQAAVVVSFSIGRFDAVAAAVRTVHADADIVLVPDRGAEQQAAKVAAKVGGHWVELPSDLPKNADAWDLWIKDGKAKGRAALRAILDALKSPGDDPFGRVDWTDAGNAALLTQIADGNLRYVFERKVWIRWNGNRWTDDDDNSQATGYALRVAAHYFEKAEKLRVDAKGAPPAIREKMESLARDHEKWAEKCRSKSFITNMLDLAARFPDVAISAKRLDANPVLLGVDNGVVDLGTGELRAAARDDLITKRSPLAFDPDAGCPKFQGFIREITGRPLPVEYEGGGIVPGSVGQFKVRAELADYLQLLAGYVATGYTKEQKLFVTVGAGSNGKSVLFDLLRWVLGAYAITCPPDLLLETKAGFSGGASPDIAALAGSRLALASETKEGQKFSPATIKRLTGGDSLTGRFLYANPITFEPSHKLVLQTNAVPSLDHLDAAIKGRLHLIPFERRWNRPGESKADPALPNGDPNLVQTLRAEGPGILAWIVQGAVRYLKEGLEPPDEVRAMTDDYFADQDTFGKWLALYEPCDPKHGTSAKELLVAFKEWCDSEGLDSDASQKSFGPKLLARGYKKLVTKGPKLYGLRLKTQEPEVPEENFEGKL